MSFPTKANPQLCKKGCGVKIYLSNDSGKWLPYNVDNDNKHDCPNYGSKSSSPSTFKKTDTLGRLAELETHMESKFMDLERRMRDVESVNKALQLQYGFIKGTKVQTTEVIEDEVIED